jgi:LCP family protein required for cell wall assembly
VIKQVQFSENQVMPHQVELPENQVELPENQLIPDVQDEIELKQSAANRSVVESVSSIPNELYDRLGLSMPRWLLWILTAVLGIVLSGLLVSTLALWTPLWSDLDRTDEELLAAGKDPQKTPMPGELAGKLSQYKLSRPMNILIMGIEPTKGTVDGSPESFAGKSDTMLLVRLNPSDKSIRVLSIPRDTMTTIPEKGLTKISDANAQGGPVLAARVVSRTLNNAPIDRYIRISTSGLRQLVDQLGGVEVYVPSSMEYQDPSGEASLVRGWQTLNGDQADEFVRYRDPGMGDLPRVQRQQALLMALVNFSANVDRDNFQMTMLPGIFSRLSQDPNSYWLDMTGQQRLLNDYVGVNLTGVQPDVRPVQNLKITIQNASNQPQLTEKVIKYLKQKGFTKINTTSDWPDTQRQTQIIVQKGNRQTGVDLQNILGLGNIDVSSIGDLESDLTIRIGKDWK